MATAGPPDNKSKQGEQKQAQVQIARTHGLRRAVPVVLSILFALLLGLASILWNDGHVLASHIATWAAIVLAAASLAIIYDNHTFKRRLPRRRAKIAWLAFSMFAIVSVPATIWYHAAQTDSTRTNQRAWVNIKQVTLNKLAVGDYLTATITLENVGASPAVLTSWGVMNWFQKSPEEYFEKVKNRHRMGIEESPNMSLAIGPHATTEFISTSPHVLTAAELGAMKTGERFFGIVGEFVYRDTANTRHYTRFCYGYDIEGKRFIASPYGNDED